MTLEGARVLVTRAAEDAESLEILLRDRGAIPVRMPCISFEDGSQVAQVVQHLRNLPDLVIVSSPHAARRLLALVGRIDVPLAAVGEGTAALLPGDVIVPKRGVGASALVEELKDRVRGKRVLIPRAERSNPELINGLTRAGAQVEALTLYRTVTPKSADPEVLRELREGGIDAITFASGSAVRGFVALAGAQSASRSAVVCMGGSAAGEAGAAGIRIDAAGFDGLPQLCDALADVLSRRRRET